MLVFVPFEAFKKIHERTFKSQNIVVANLCPGEKPYIHISSLEVVL